jgi:hypothetical protein
VKPFQPGFSDCPKAFWWLEQEIDDLAKALHRADQGVFGPIRNPTLSGHTVLKRFGWSRARCKRWEKRCPFLPSGKLTPVWLGWGRGQKKGRLRTYALRDLVVIRCNRRKTFEGVYLDAGSRRRLNLTRLAEEFPQFARSTWERIVEDTRCPFHPQVKLPSEKRLRPMPPFKEEITVLESEAEVILENVKQKLATMRPAGDWYTAKQLMAVHKVTDGSERIKFNALLRALQDAGLLHPRKFFRETRFAREAATGEAFRWQRTRPISRGPHGCGSAGRNQ